MTDDPTKADDAAAVEVNFDGLVGPTHGYAGLSPGNVASAANASERSRPREAALQGLAKMRRCLELGLVQGVLPPHPRPAVGVLRRLGFAPAGADGAVLQTAAAASPRTLAMCSSASAMWTANAATVSPSADTRDGRLHLTPANLHAHFHRAIEAETTARLLRAIFADDRRCVVHDPLPPHELFGDEGAANHARVCARHGTAGVELFTFGRFALRESWADSDPAAPGDTPGPPEPERHIARQTFEASRAIASAHGLDPARVVYAQQEPAAIDAGVFHNDVIAVANGPVVLYHEHAWVGTDGVIDELAGRLRDADGTELVPVGVRSEAVTLGEAVRTYLFNSQLLTLPDGTMLLLAPREAERSARVREAINRIVADPSNPIERAEYLNLRQSMRNGGGPACLRLRVVLTPGELAAVRGRVIVDNALLDTLEAWVRRHYREELAPADLGDPRLLDESRAALDELAELLGLPAWW